MNHLKTAFDLTRFWRAAVLGLMLAGTAAGPVLAQTVPAQTPYQRLGGYDGVAASVNCGPRLLQCVRGHAGRSALPAEESAERSSDHGCDQLEAAAAPLTRRLRP